MRADRNQVHSPAVDRAMGTHHECHKAMAPHAAHRRTRQWWNTKYEHKGQKVHETTIIRTHAYLFLSVLVVPLVGQCPLVAVCQPLVGCSPPPPSLRWTASSSLRLISFVTHWLQTNAFGNLKNGFKKTKCKAGTVDAKTCNLSMLLTMKLLLARPQKLLHLQLPE